MVGFTANIDRESTDEREAALVAVVREFHLRGWLPATSGNVSFRTRDGFMVSASGVDKTGFGPEHLLAVDAKGTVPGDGSGGDREDDGERRGPGWDARGSNGAREDGTVAAPAIEPSAETALHAALYAALPEVRAVLHTHSHAATVLGLRHAGDGELSFCGYELLKGLAGVDSHEVEVRLPILANSQDMGKLAKALKGHLKEAAEAAVKSGGKGAAVTAPGVLVAGHGLYVWGESIAAAKRHAETLEFLLGCHLVPGGGA